MSEMRKGVDEFDEEDDDDIFRAAFSSGINGGAQSTGKVKIEGQQQQQQQQHHQQQQQKHKEENKQLDHERSKHHKETESECKKFLSCMSVKPQL